MEIATRLHQEKGLPDIADLLLKLNDARKATAYGDVERPDLDAEGIASEIEEYVETVKDLLSGGEDDD